MKLKFLFFIPAFCFTFVFKTNAQYKLCGTEVTKAQIEAEKAKLANPNQVQFAPINCFGKTLSLTIHVVSDSLGNYNLSMATLQAAIQTLNSNFAPICLSFQICTIDSIKNYKYDRYLKPIEEAELLALYYIPKTINIYFAATVEITPGNTVGGYAYFPGGPDFIIISKGAAGSIKTISHEMGHFFGLYHTFETSFGNELADGSNCSTSGDLICDTPADPGLSNSPSPICNLSPGAQDPNGQWYVPNIGNIMSYYSDDCTCGFTTDQYNKMASNYLSSRFYLW